MKKKTFIAALLLGSVSIAAPAWAHCGSCGMGGEEATQEECAAKCADAADNAACEQACVQEHDAEHDKAKK